MLVLELEAFVWPKSISDDGEVLLFDSGVFPNRDVGILALDTDQEPEMLVATAADESGGGFSPDGRFFVFNFNETAGFGVYAHEVASGSTFSVSTSSRGGAVARWSRDGTEIYYRPTDGTPGILVAEVTMEPFSASDPVESSDIRVRRLTNFDVTADGQRFLVTTLPVSDITDPATATPRINVILNWFEELKERVPTGR